MTATPRLLAFTGSLREGSYNLRLIPVLAEGARTAGAEVTLAELRDYSMPGYDADIEAAGMPPRMRQLRRWMREHDGMRLSTPGYHGSLPALVKNTLDSTWRPVDDGRMGAALFQDQVCGTVSAAPGALGGMRRLLVLRGALARLGLAVVPRQAEVGQAADKLVAYGQGSDDKQRAAVGGFGAAVAWFTAARLAVPA